MVPAAMTADPSWLWFAAPPVVLASWVLTGVVRRYAIARAILDLPNTRSSHATPVPRGGGLAIVVTVLATILVAFVAGRLPPHAAAAFLGGGTLVALVGWLDDRRGLGAVTRAVSHLAAAAWAVAWFGGLPTLRVGTTSMTLGPLGSVLAVLGIAWCVNFYNFMDGIDGIAAGEGLVVGAFATAVLAALGSPLAVVALGITAACGGFLPHNWSPARIFMGDVASGFLGFVFGALALAAEREGSVPVLAFALALGVFVGDATVTLVRRAARGEPWYSAHRSHAYQRAVASGFSHARTTLGVLGTTALLCALAALAVAVPRLLGTALAAGAVLVGGAYLWIERRRAM